MGDCLVAGACCVDVGALVGGEDCEGGGREALGRDVYMCAAEGGGGDEEDGLREGPGGEVGGERGVVFYHVDGAGFDRVLKKTRREGSGRGREVRRRQSRTEKGNVN